jgi:hypothetical protein
MTASSGNPATIKRLLYPERVLTRMLIGLVAAGAAVLGSSAMAAAEPEPAPPPPPPPFNVNALAPVTPSEFAQQNGDVYAFAIPGDIACIMSRGTGGYGCSGPLPAAPEGANVVTGGQQGAPGFANATRPIYNFETLPKRLEPGKRISFRNVTCGTDGTVTVCQNNFDQAGFVLSPAGSYVLNPSNPLLDRPDNKNPYFN